MSTPVVSVVMIFKDAAPYLREAADSVLAQTWADLELLLVDDGGSDGSDGLAEQVAAHDDRATVLRHPGRANLGMSAARSLGVGNARGELVAFLDADDRWDPEHLRGEVDLLLSRPEAGMVCGRAWTWHSWEDPRTPDRLSPLPFAPGVVVPPPRLLAATLRNGALATPTCSLLVRAEALRNSGGPVASFTGMYEDQVLNSLLQLRVPAVISGGATAWYRQHAASASAVAQRDGSYHPAAANASRLRFLRWLDGQPELASASCDAELRGLLDAALAEQEVTPAQRVRPVAVVRAAARRLPPGAKRRLRRGLSPLQPALVRLAGLGRLEPVSRQFGYDRGLPVDRWYVERFLARCGEDVRGRVLEVGDSSYTEQYGGARVTRADVVNVREGMAGTTYVGDLTDGTGLPEGVFDCIVLTQTLHLVFDVHAAARTLHRLLRPGGVLLLTVPGITPISTDEWAATWHWSFTEHSARRLFGEVFGPLHVEVQQHGNVQAATAFLQGLAAEEVPDRVLGHDDPQFPLLVTVRAVRPAGATGA